MQGQRKRNLMSVDELAQFLNVSRGYVERKLLRKHVPRPVIVVGGRRYVLRAKSGGLLPQTQANCAQGAARAGACVSRGEDVPVKTEC